MGWITKKIFTCDRCCKEVSEKQLGMDECFHLSKAPYVLSSSTEEEKCLVKGISLCPSCGKDFLTLFDKFMKNVDSDFDDRKIIIDGDPEAEEPRGVITHSMYVPKSNDDTPSMEDEAVDEDVERAAWIVIERGAHHNIWIDFFYERSHEEILQRVAIVFADQDVILDIDRNEESKTKVAVYIKEMATKGRKKGM